MEKVSGYCPLCGELYLIVRRKGAKRYACCPRGTTVDDSHTAVLLAEEARAEKPEPVQKDQED